MRVLAVLLLISCSGGGPTCNGCTDSSGTCQPGTSADACGASGLCVQCSGASNRCSASQHVCGPCGAANCSGCCTSDGRCIVEIRERDANCGFNGVACVDCMAMAKTCSTTTLSCK